jgi:hypothetical protein
VRSLPRLATKNELAEEARTFERKIRKRKEKKEEKQKRS